MIYSYNANDLRKKVYSHFTRKHVNTQPYLTSKMLGKGFAFVDGFIACLKFMAEDPISTKEVDELILNELIEFLTQEINKDHD